MSFSTVHLPFSFLSRKYVLEVNTKVEQGNERNR